MISLYISPSSGILQPQLTVCVHRARGPVPRQEVSPAQVQPFGTPHTSSASQVEPLLSPHTHPQSQPVAWMRSLPACTGGSGRGGGIVGSAAVAIWQAASETRGCRAQRGWSGAGPLHAHQMQAARTVGAAGGHSRSPSFWRDCTAQAALGQCRRCCTTRNRRRSGCWYTCLARGAEKNAQEHGKADCVASLPDLRCKAHVRSERAWLRSGWL